MLFVQLLGALEERVVLPAPDEVEREEAEADDACDAADCAADDGADVAGLGRGDTAGREGECCVAVPGDVEDAVQEL